MKRKRFTEEQIIGILKEWEAGLHIGELSRKYGVSDKSLYLWRRKFGGMEVPDAKRLRALEEENRKLKRIVADLTLDITMLKDVLSKKW
jgi:putative transposase